MNDKVKLFVLAGIFFLAITGFYFLLMRNAGQTDSSQIEKASVSQGGKTVKKTEVSNDADLHEIYLAGGCFWGVEEYFSRVPGVTDAVSGYANGRGETTKYELINQTGHAETVHVTYDAEVMKQDFLEGNLISIIGDMDSLCMSCLVDQFVLGCFPSTVCIA